MQSQVHVRRDRVTSMARVRTQVLALVALIGIVAAAGCTAGRAFGRGNDAARAGEWDVAVEQYRQALQSEPDNVEYRVAFQRAMRSASIHYYEQARVAEARGQMDVALAAYRRANEFEPANRQLAAKVSELERRIRDQAEAALPRPAIQQLRDNAQQAGPAPLARLNEVLPRISFNNANVRDILTSIGDGAGINVTFERDVPTNPPPYSVQMDGVTLEQALNQIVGANQLFYKVLNPKTIMIIGDTAAKRLQYEEQVIKVLRLSHADATEVVNMVQTVGRQAGTQVQFQVAANKTQNTITLRAPTAMASIIERLVEITDKPRAEVVVDVEILEVNHRRMKQYGLDLGNYTIGAVFSPEVDPRTDDQLRSPPFNLSSATPVGSDDFYLAVPAAAIRFLEEDQDSKLLAKPQLRGAEGEELTLDLGEEVPIPTTVFTPVAQGGANVNPLSSFTYRTVGIVLKMTPRVTYEGEVILDLSVENSTRGADVNISGSNMPTFLARKATAKLRLRDGESNLLAGLIRQSDRKSLRGIPGILRLPIIKQLFSANDTTIETTDIVMLLTPRIVRTHELTQRDIDPLFIGTPNNLGLGGPPPLIAQPEPGPVGAAPAPPPAGGAAAQPPAGGAPPALTPPNTPPPGAANQTPAVPPAATAAVPTAPVRDAATPVGAALSSPPGSPTSGAGAQIILSPSATEFRPGTNPSALINANVMGTSRLSGVSLTVTYNPAALRVISVQQGSFMGSGGSAVTFTENHATPGRIDIVLMRTADKTGAVGTGMLAAMIFEAVGAGSANLNITGTATAPGGGSVPVQFVVPAVTVK